MILLFCKILKANGFGAFLPTNTSTANIQKQNLKTVIWEKEIAPWLEGTGTTVDMILEKMKEIMDIKEYTGLQQRLRQRIQEQCIIKSDLPSNLLVTSNNSIHCFLIGFRLKRREIPASPILRYLMLDCLQLWPSIDCFVFKA